VVSLALKFRERYPKVGTSLQANNICPRCKFLNRVMTVIKYGMGIMPLEDIPRL